MYRSLFALAAGVALGLAASAQTAAPPVTAPATAPATTGALRGHIADPTGALIPGASVTLTTSAGGTVTTTTADSAGAFTFVGLAPGGYILDATAAGFANFSSPTIQLAAGQSKRVDISMAIEVAQQSVEVSDETPQVNVEAAGNASAVVLKGKDLDALSDDPDELSNELSALAGPSAGPNGGQIYIDGFTGGQLPPKSAIREIRINQNPFSAEFDRLGYGRIEILTKPGTDKLHGQFFAQGNDSAFNTGSPFDRNVPPYNRVQFNGTVSGALGKKASFFLSVEERDNHDENIYVYTPAVLNTVTNSYEFGSLTSGSEANPHNRVNVSPRIDVQLGDKNTLTLRYQFYHDTESGDINSTQLPTQSLSTSSNEHTVQLSDSEIINDHIVNETRFEYRRALNAQTPVSALPTIGVAGDFTGGGAAGQAENDHSDHFELQNFTTMSAGRQAIKFGVWARDNRDASSSFDGHNGALTFTQPGYLDALNALALNQPLSSLPQGDLISYSVAAGQTSYTANVFDAALFLQDDVKVNPRLTLSGGLRWETQNHVADHDDWAPRVAMAYALDAKGNKPAKTVVRAGYGLFYDRLQVDNLLSATRQGRDSGQVQITSANASCLNATSLSSIDFSACLPAQPYLSNAQSTLVQISPSYRSPVSGQLGASLERQVTKTTTFTVTYLHTYGVHQMVTRDANAFEPGSFQFGNSALTGTRPDPSLGIINEFYPEGIFKQNQMILNANARISPKFSVFGFYNLSFANSDSAGGTASNSYNIKQDYGRAAFVARNMVFLMGNYTGPWAIRFNPFLIANAGHPYNIVSSDDLTGDNYLNDRPAAVDSSLCAAGSTRYYQTTSFGCLDAQPDATESLLPANAGTGPAAVALNLRVSRSFGFGPKVAAGTANADGGPPRGGPGGGGGRGGGGPGGGPGGGLGPGGLGGGGRGPGGMFGGAGNNRKFTLNLSAQALNLFNNVNYGTPNGTVGSEEFGRSTTLSGGPFSAPGGSAVRRIFFQAVVSF